MSIARVRDVSLVIGLLMSAGFWLIHQRFYSELGIAPGDVGIGFGQVFERSIGGAVFILLFSPLFALVLSPVFAMFIALVDRNKPPVAKMVSLQPRSARLNSGQRALSPLLLVGVVLPYLVWVAIDDAVTMVSVVLVAVFAIASTWQRVILIDAAAIRAAGFAALGVTLITFVYLAVIVGSAASQAREGKRVEIGVFGLSAFDAIKAVPARFRLDNVNRCALYLGAADGASVLLDPREDVVLRVPSGVAMTLDPDLEHC